MSQQTQNLNVREVRRLVSPQALKAELPMNDAADRMVYESREVIKRILDKEDPRLLVVIGPCSIHDVAAAREYAERLKEMKEELADSLYIVMRVYFEKPRTTIGWKGLINDPHLNGSEDIETGIKMARELLLRIAELGLPAATEFLDPIVPQYLDDQISWAAIGARTTESQTHRQMASGLSMPVGFKNGTDGSLNIAIDALGAARHPHSFLGIDQEGVTSVIRTSGNHYGHVVLRGGKLRTNYDAESIAAARGQLAKAKLPEALMVDCSHANSGKQHARQEEVWQSVIEQRLSGDSALIGLMVESNINEGNQPIPSDLAALRYGVSITDACIGWDTTVRMLRYAAQEVRQGGLVGA